MSASDFSATDGEASARVRPGPCPDPGAPGLQSTTCRPSLASNLRQYASVLRTATVAMPTMMKPASTERHLPDDLVESLHANPPATGNAPAGESLPRSLPRCSRHCRTLAAIALWQRRWKLCINRQNLYRRLHDAGAQTGRQGGGNTHRACIIPETGINRYIPFINSGENHGIHPNLHSPPNAQTRQPVVKAPARPAAKPAAAAAAKPAGTAAKTRCKELPQDLWRKPLPKPP